jgi:hypothetical protein
MDFWPKRWHRPDVSTKSKGGRPTRLTPELIEQLVNPIRELGLFRRRAAALAQVDEGLFSKWYRRGRGEKRGIYAAFADEVDRAEAEYQEKTLRQLQDASAADPRLKLKLLERRFPEEYGRHDNVAPDDEEGKAADAAKLRETLMERLERLLPAPDPQAAAPAAEQAGG